MNSGNRSEKKTKKTSQDENVVSSKKMSIELLEIRTKTVVDVLLTKINDLCSGINK